MRPLGVWRVLVSFTWKRSAETYPLRSHHSVQVRHEEARLEERRLLVERRVRLLQVLNEAPFALEMVVPRDLSIAPLPRIAQHRQHQHLQSVHRRLGSIHDILALLDFSLIRNDIDRLTSTLGL